MCVRGIDFTGFCNFSITFTSCSDGVVFYVFHCLCLLLSKQTLEKTERAITDRQYRDTGNIVYKTQNEDKHLFFITIIYRHYRNTGNIVYKKQKDEMYPFIITLTYRQYRDTGNIVYKIQNEDKHLFFITINYRQYSDTGNIVYKIQN
jgi:hypothetical protein